MPGDKYYIAWYYQVLKEQLCIFSKQWFTSAVKYLFIITTVLLIVLSLFSHIWLLQPHNWLADSKTKHLCRTTQLKAICSADPFRPAQVLLNTILEHVSFNIHGNRGGVMRCILKLRMFCKQNYPFCESIIVEASTWSPYSFPHMMRGGRKWHSCPRAFMEEQAILSLLTAIKTSFSQGSVLSCLCWELLSQTYPAVPCEHRDLVFLSRKIMDYNPNILKV